MKFNTSSLDPVRVRLPVRVLYIWFMALAAVAFVALMWFIFDIGLASLFTSMSTTYPDYMSDKGVQFFHDIWTWWPTLALMGIGYWVWVASHRPENRQGF